MVNPSTMSREQLDSEARRIGVIAPERLGRAALERRIRDHHASPLRRARRAFRGLVDIAKAIAGAPPALPRNDPPAPAKTAPAPAAEPEKRQAPEAPPPAEEKPSPAPVAKPKPASRAQAPSEAPAPLKDEPIPTRTMARLLADQGHTRRALAIYRKLLHEQPSDDDLRREVDRLEASGRGRSARKSPTAESSDDDESEGVEVVALAVGDASVLVAWSVAGRALAEAEALLESEGSLEARVVVVRADAEGAIRREVHERPAESDGEWVVPVHAGARVTAAVGLHRDGRFVSVAHAPVIIAGT